MSKPYALLPLLLAALAGCRRPPPPALAVVIPIGPQVRASCVKLAVLGGPEELTTAALPREGQSELTVAVFRTSALPATVTLEARGYAFSDCTGLNEVSEKLSATFPPSGVAGVNVPLDALPPSLDADRDGYRADSLGGGDCDDRDYAVHPNAEELCGDGLDNDCRGGGDCADRGCAARACGEGATCGAGACGELACDDGKDNDRDGTRDCADPDCAGKACGNNGACDAARHCTGATAELCADLVDNDGDGLVDCADTADCAAKRCEDGDLCTEGETCVSPTSCGGGAAVKCQTPPGPCYAASGTCAAATGLCSYGFRAQGEVCADLNLCTAPDSCDGAGRCVGGPDRACGKPGTCEAEPGTCEPTTGACQYAPAPAGERCDDGNPCTAGDTCGAERGCAGSLYACASPSECRVGLCLGDGGCGSLPSAPGTGCPGGACTATGTCARAFTFAPSNFTADGGTALGDVRVDCDVVFDTTNVGTQPLLWCGRPGPTPYVVNAGAAAPDLVVLPMTGLHVVSGGSLRFSGTRAVALAVYGDARVDGVVEASAQAALPGPGAMTACVGEMGQGAALGGGGGGGGFGTSAGSGGESSGKDRGGKGSGMQGMDALRPLRGGCPGGQGGGPAGGGGGPPGGALQISVSRTLTVTGRLSAAGGAGRGATVARGGGGGGGSGGAILLEATALELAGAQLTANGGAGGEGFHQDDSGNVVGKTGEDGHLTDALPALGGDDPTNTHGGFGGRGGSAGFNPTDGNNGNANNGVNQPTGGGGGGGGAAGRITLLPHGACTKPAVVSPPAAVMGGTCN